MFKIGYILVTCKFVDLYNFEVFIHQSFHIYFLHFETPDFIIWDIDMALNLWWILLVPGGFSVSYEQPWRKEGLKEKKNKNQKCKNLRS